MGIIGLTGIAGVTGAGTRIVGGAGIDAGRAGASIAKGAVTATGANTATSTRANTDTIRGTGLTAAICAVTGRAGITVADGIATITAVVCAVTGRAGIAADGRPAVKIKVEVGAEVEVSPAGAVEVAGRAPGARATGYL